MSLVRVKRKSWVPGLGYENVMKPRSGFCVFYGTSLELYELYSPQCSLDGCGSWATFSGLSRGNATLLAGEAGGRTRDAALSALQLRGLFPSTRAMWRLRAAPATELPVLRAGGGTGIGLVPVGARAASPLAQTDRVCGAVVGEAF